LSGTEFQWNDFASARQKKSPQGISPEGISYITYLLLTSFKDNNNKRDSSMKLHRGPLVFL
jgi:hypothetical protein